jgi:5-methyltetrahydrofolate--homocysteine methyltransferase
MEDQAPLFAILEIERHQLGLHLTEGFMMEPESSTSGLVFHHPECKYFSPSATDIERYEAEASRAG